VPPVPDIGLGLQRR